MKTLRQELISRGIDCNPNSSFLGSEETWLDEIDSETTLGSLIVELIATTFDLSGELEDPHDADRLRHAIASHCNAISLDHLRQEKRKTDYIENGIVDPYDH